jgi:hypothetical protein
VRGTLTNLNAALSGLKFTPTTNYTGSSSLVVTLQDSGDKLSGSATVAITVKTSSTSPTPTNVPNDAAPVSVSNSTSLANGRSASQLDLNDEATQGRDWKPLSRSSTRECAPRTLTGATIYTNPSEQTPALQVKKKSSIGVLSSRLTIQHDVLPERSLQLPCSGRTSLFRPLGRRGGPWAQFLCSWNAHVALPHSPFFRLCRDFFGFFGALKKGGVFWARPKKSIDQQAPHPGSRVHFSGTQFSEALRGGWFTLG